MGSNRDLTGFQRDLMGIFNGISKGFNGYSWDVMVIHRDLTNKNGDVRGRTSGN
jgi:hypothetical protein